MAAMAELVQDPGRLPEANRRTAGAGLLASRRRADHGRELADLLRRGFAAFSLASLRGIERERRRQNATRSPPLRASIWRASAGLATSSESPSRMPRTIETCSALEVASFPLPA